MTDPGELAVRVAVATSLADLEERVAALEEMIAHPPLWHILPHVPELTAEQAAEIRDSAEAALRAGPFEHRVIPQPPPLTPDEIRHLLRECVTVVKPGETLVIRGRDWTPNQMRELQRVMDAWHEDGLILFRALIVPGDELGVVQPEPDFMSEVRTDIFRDSRGEAVRLTHLPTGVTVEAPTREEAQAKLGRALTRRDSGPRPHSRPPGGTPGAA